MAQLDFETLKTAWSKLRQDRESDLKRMVPDLSDPQEIYLKRVSEDDTRLVVQFAGLRRAVQNQNSIPQVKRLIMTWVRNFSLDAQQGRSDTDNLLVSLSKELKFGEAAISIFKRNPKTNKKQTAYRCIGGKKDGRRVSNPNDCIGVPDPGKKIKLAITKRGKYGQAAKSRKKTQLTNITAKRIRKANSRLKKARGF